MNSNDINIFIEKNISNFQLNGSGWNNLIKKMLFEFCIAGWDLNLIVGGKEKFGGLRCYIDLEDKVLEKKITTIVGKYAALSLITCENCGGANARKRIDTKSGWETTLCKHCYFKRELAFKDTKNKTSDNSLSECSICGYIAITDSFCNFCNHFTYLSESKIYKPTEYYASEDEYVKECQIENFLDEENEIELNTMRKHFKKSDSHQIIFTIEDLNRYNADHTDE